MVSFSLKSGFFTLVVLLASFNAGMAFGQVVTGSILGRVTDTSGGVVAGATIQIQNGATGFSRTVQSDPQGRYAARNLPVGTYSLTTQQAGFTTAERQGVTLAVAGEVTINFELTVGAITEKVEVTGEAPAIETTNATLSGVVNPEQIRDLPLNGRDYQQLALLSPGAIANHNAGFVASQGMGMRLSVDGARADANLFLLDGTVTNDHSTQGSGAGAGGESLGVEGILEFRLLTHNFSAEYGRNAGAVVSAVTRSGTNDFHGTAYEFVRNNIFDARNFFNVGNAPAPSPLPPLRRNQFGAALGGRIKRDRVFFFLNYEGLREAKSRTIIQTVPTADVRRGIIPGQAAPINVDPRMVPYLTNPLIWPLPTPGGRDFGNGTAQYIANAGFPVTENYSMARGDIRISDKDSFFMRNVYDPSQRSVPQPAPNFLIVTEVNNHFVVLSETHIFSGTKLNDFRFAFNRTYPSDIGEPVSPIDPSLSFISGLLLGGLQVQGSGLTNTGNPGAQPHALNQNLFEETDTFTLVRGAHSLKFGGDIERIQLNVREGDPIKGIYRFGSLANMLLANANRFTFMQLGGYSTNSLGWRQTLFGWFIQDDYRVRPNLTLNLGLRHEFLTSPYEVFGRSGTMLNWWTDTKSTFGNPFVTKKANFAPRVGLAWDPTGSGKTSIRLGGGVFFNHVLGRTWFSNADSDATANRATVAVFAGPGGNPPIPFPHGSLGTIGTTSLDTFINQYHMGTPTVIHYNLEVQRQLMRTISIQFGYVGSVGYDQLRGSMVDTVIPRIQPDGSKFFPADGPLFNNNFTSIDLNQTDAHYNYNALQVALQKTISVGLRFQASYTWSHALDNASNDSEPDQNSSTTVTTLDPFNLARDYGHSGYDQRQTFVFNSSYQMPWEKRLNGKLAKTALGGWGVNGIFSYDSGLPLVIYDGINQSRNNDPNVVDRPNLAPGASINPIHGVTAGCSGIPAGQKLHTPNLWYDPCAFQLEPAGTYGNLGRDTVTLPGIVNVDFSLVKITPVTEKIKLEFRAEFFNLFNHANFQVPTRIVLSSNGSHAGNAGVVSATSGDNRDIQLGMKLTF